MSQDTRSRKTDRWAIFFDLDGFLDESALTERRGHASRSLKELLNSLCERFDGALALLSARPIVELDRLLAPYRFCAMGVHGCETRDATGCLSAYPKLDATSFDVARVILHRLVERHRELEFEDRRFALTIHFGHAHHLRLLVRTVMNSVAQVLGQGFRVYAGERTYEVRPSAWNKATAIGELMRSSPFRERTPVLIGDALSDESAFAFVNGCQGITLRVGLDSGSVAHFSFANMTEATHWLSMVPPVAPPPNARSGAHRSGWDWTEL